MGTETLQHEGGWGEILRVICRDLGLFCQQRKQTALWSPSLQVQHLGIVCAVQVPFLVSILLFVVT